MWRTLYLAALLGVGSSLAALALYAAQYRSGPGVRWLVASLVSSACWTTLTVLALLLGEPLAGLGVRLFGDPFTAQLWLELLTTVSGLLSVGTWVMFVIHYTGRTDLFTRPVRTAILGLVGGLMALVVTTPHHGLVYATDGLGTKVSNVGELMVFVPAPGPLFGVVVAVGVAVMGLSIWLLLGLFWTNNRLFSGQALVVLIGVLAPVVMAVPRFVGTVVPPLVPIGFAITCVCFAYALFVKDFLTLTPAVSYVGTRDAIADLDSGVVLTSADGRVLKGNRIAGKLLDVDDFAGRSIGSVLSPLGLSIDQLPGRVSYQGRYLAISKAPITDDFDRRIGTTITVRDVTDRQLREQRLQVLNRLIRHNIRNDLGVVEGYASMLQAESSQDVTRVAARIERKAEEVVALSENARIVERLFAAPPQVDRLDVRSQLEEFAAQLERQYPQTTIHVDVEGSGSIVTDHLGFEEALWAITENAAEYADSDQPIVHLVADCSEAETEIRVEDNGSGIPDVELDGIRKESVTPLEHGSGLGLWIAHWGVRRLEGDLSFERREDGTVVTVTVPCLEDRDGIDPDQQSEATGTALLDDRFTTDRRRSNAAVGMDDGRPETVVDPG